MKPEEAISLEIQELERRIRHLKDAKALLSHSPNVVEYDDITAFQNAALEVFKRAPLQGYTAADVARQLNADEYVMRKQVMPALEKNKLLERTNPGQRRYKRYRAVEVDVPTEETTPEEAPTSAPAKPKPKKRRKHSGGVKPGYMTPKVKARYEEFKRWLETVPAVTTGAIIRELGFNRAQAGDLIKFGVRDNILVFERMVPPTNADGSKAVAGRESKQYVSIPYQQARETVVHVGDGVRTGRLYQH